MNIQRISETLIRCTIDNSELLYDYGIDSSAPQNEIIKAVQEHINDIVLECLEEEDVTPSSSLVKVNVVLTKDSNLILDINLDSNSEPDIFGKPFNAPALDDDMEAEDNPFCNLLKQMIDKVQNHLDAMEERNSKYYSEVIDEMSIYGFDTLDMVINFSKIIKDIEFDSTLYKFNDKYFLCLNKHMRKIDNVALEFGGTDSNYGNGFINEHGDLMIKKDAVKNLAML